MDPILTGLIISALKAVMGIPSFAVGAIDLHKKYSKKSKKGGALIALKGPLKEFLEKEKKRFKKIMDKYHEIDENEEYDEVEKNKYRKRISAQLCKILKLLEPKKDEIDEYDELVEIFCVKATQL